MILSWVVLFFSKPSYYLYGGTTSNCVCFNEYFGETGLAVEAYERNQQYQTFPENPDDFNPPGLTRRIFDTRNGKIYKWFTPDNVAVYEWDEDYTYGPHYHVIGPDGNTRLPNDSGETHFNPGDNIPSP